VVWRSGSPRLRSIVAGRPGLGNRLALLCCEPTANRLSPKAILGRGLLHRNWPIGPRVVATHPASLTDLRAWVTAPELARPARRNNRRFTPARTWHGSGCPNLPKSAKAAGSATTSHPAPRSFVVTHSLSGPGAKGPGVPPGGLHEVSREPADCMQAGVQSGRPGLVHRQAGLRDDEHRRVFYPSELHRLDISDSTSSWV
jgi:hypothetical protein